MKTGIFHKILRIFCEPPGLGHAARLLLGTAVRRWGMLRGRHGIHALGVAVVLDGRADEKTEHDERNQFDFIDGESHSVGPRTLSYAYLPRISVLKKCPFDCEAENALKTFFGTSR